jgi:hypothetical protein
MVNSTQRNYRDALRELERLQTLTPDPTPPPSPETSPQPPAPQPAETEPVNHSGQFVSSTSSPPFPAAPAASQRPLPFHSPGGPQRLYFG